MAIDNGPKRIVFVVETGKRVPEPARKIEVSVLSQIVSDTRPEDSFALITAHGPLKKVRFGESRDALRSSILGLKEIAQGKNQQSGILDALQEDITWLQPHQTGDAIVVLTIGIEHDPSRINYKNIRQTLTSAGIRLFGFQLGTIVAGYANVSLTPVPGGLVPTADISPNRESFSLLCVQSGGSDFIEATDHPIQTYKLTDERLALLNKAGTQIYKAIRECYLLTIAPVGGFEIAQSARAKVPNAVVTYPREKNLCLQTADQSANR